MLPTPECDKLAKVKDKSQIIGEFLDHIMNVEGLSICESVDDHYESGWVPLNKSIEQILAAYFGIDLDKVEQEKRAILKDLSKNSIAVV